MKNFIKLLFEIYSSVYLELLECLVKFVIMGVFILFCLNDVAYIVISFFENNMRYKG